MKLIFDASVAAKIVLAEVDSDKAIAVRDDYVNGVHQLLAPDIFPAELAHTLTRAERQNRITVGEAERHWQNVMLSRPVLVPYLTLSLRAIELSSALRIGYYDCLYVALAEREKCQFLTADDKIIKNLRTQFPFILSLADLP